MKNLKNLILNVTTCLLSVLFLIFMSQPHIVLEAGGAGSGYNYIRFDSTDGKYVALAVGLLIATIIACVLLLTSIYGILRCFDVIKANPADKVIRILNLVAVVVGMIMITLAFVMDICIVVEYNDKYAVLDVLKANIGWAIGVNFAFYAFTTVAVCLMKPYAQQK